MSDYDALIRQKKKRKERLLCSFFFNKMMSLISGTKICVIDSLFNKSMGSADVHVHQHDQGATLYYCKQGKKK